MSLSFPLWLGVWPVLALLALLVAHGPAPAWRLNAFFALALVWPALLVAGRLWGARVAALAGAGAMALLLLPAAVAAPPLADQPAGADRFFDGPADAARTTFRLPEAAARRWTGTTAPAAYVYVLGIRRREEPRGSLTVLAGATELGTLSPASLLIPDTPPPPGKTPDPIARGWYRLPLPAAALAGLLAGGTLDVTVAPSRDAAPGTVGLAVGHRSPLTCSAGAAAFGSLGSWSARPEAVLGTAQLSGQAAGQRRVQAGDLPDGDARFFVELRLVDPATHLLLAVYC